MSPTGHTAIVSPASATGFARTGDRYRDRSRQSQAYRAKAVRFFARTDALHLKIYRDHRNATGSIFNAFQDADDAPTKGFFDETRANSPKYA